MKKLIIVMASFLFMLFICCPASSYPINTNIKIMEKIDLNRVRPAYLKSIFIRIGLNGELAEKLTGLRSKRGEFARFDELLEAGMTAEQIALLEKHFFIESKRNDPEEIIRKWSAAGWGSPDHFYGLMVYPMDLNSVREESLRELPCIGPEGAEKIVQYRKKNEIKGLYDLTNAGLRTEDLMNASPFVTIRPAKDRGFTLRSNVAYRSEEKTFQNGAPDDTDTDARDLEIRSSMEIQRFRFYFASRTTNGFFSGSPLSWTELSSRSRYYALLSADSIRFVAGHYQLAFGQNLLLGPAFTPPVTGFEGSPARKTDKGLSPCSSLSTDPDGNGVRDVFNGFAISFDLREIEIFGYYPSPRFTGFLSVYDADPFLDFTNQSDYGADIRIALPAENSSAGFTAVRQTRADNKFDSTGLSFHYDLGIFDLFRVYGEAAQFKGLAAVQGFNLNAGIVKVSLMGFYSATNYNAPNASDILHARRDAQGFFTGIGFELFGLELESFADCQWKLSDPLLKAQQRYQFAARMKWRDLSEWISRFEAEARTRFSDISDGRNLRSCAGLKAGIFRDRIVLDIQWQDVLNFTESEMGNMLSVRLRFIPFEHFSMVLRWNGYRSASYQSALFDTMEAAYAGDFTVNPYYGMGNEWTAVLKWKVSEEFTLNCMVRTDSREMELQRRRDIVGLALFTGFQL